MALWLQVRWDPRKYSYLNRQDLLGWQNCGKDCWETLSSRYNIQGGPINIWVAGSFEGAFKCTPVATLCDLQANGLTTVNPGASADWKPGFEYLPTQVRWCWHLAAQTSVRSQPACLCMCQSLLESLQSSVPLSQDGLIDCCCILYTLTGRGCTQLVLL